MQTEINIKHKKELIMHIIGRYLIERMGVCWGMEKRSLGIYPLIKYFGCIYITL